MEPWRDPYIAPAELKSSTPHDPTFPSSSPSLGVASMPGYAWGKGALLFALGSTSPSQHRLQTPIVCAGILYISEQFTDTVMYYLGNQPPSTALYGYRYLAQRLYRIIPRGVALYHAGAEYVQALYEAPYASHVAAISSAPLTPK